MIRGRSLVEPRADSITFPNAHVLNKYSGSRRGFYELNVAEETA
ncbi:hypothetical protein N9B17_03245 [Rhodopirellula sp.]|nr:hypothetical protein [Rhodopirellula sp.]